MQCSASATSAPLSPASACDLCRRCSTYCPGCDPPPPHLVLILADDVGWNGVEWHNPLVKQPHLQALAQSGVVLDSFYAALACAPSRAALMTGRFSWRTAAARCNLLPASSPDGLDLKYEFIPRRLAAAGYYSIHAGKWHQGFATRAETPVGRGFNYSFGRLEGGGNHWTHASNLAELQCNANAVGGPVPGIDHWSSAGDANWDLWESSDATFPGGPLPQLVGQHHNESLYSGHLFTWRAVERILSSEYDPLITPLFLFLSLEEAHVPIDPPGRYAAMYDGEAAIASDPKRRLYYGSLSVLDEAAANVSAALQLRGMWNRTLLLWLSDNGAVVHRKGGSNHPLRGAKHSLWEGALRVPAFVAGGLIPQAMRGTVLNGLIDMADIYATLSELAGLGTSTSTTAASSDSISMWPYLSGAVASSPRAEIVHWYADAARGAPTWHGAAEGWRCERVNATQTSQPTYWPLRGAIRVGQYKLILGDNPWASWYGEHSPNATSPPKGSNAWQQALAQCGDVGCLYDIDADPTEHVDLAAALPAVASALRAKFLSINASDPANGQLDFATQAPIVDGALKFCAVVQNSGGFVGPWADV